MPKPLAAHLITTDGRGRMSLGRPNAAFMISEQSDGAIVLEPAVTMSALEARLLANDDLQERASRAHRGEGLVTRPVGRRDKR